jgi:hypothetical protein
VELSPATSVVRFVRPPTLSVALAEPTVLTFVAATGCPAASKNAGTTPPAAGTTAGFAGTPVDGGVIWGELVLCCERARPVGGPRNVEIPDKPVRRLIRSARSASRLLVEPLWW